jgi:enoyl-CoA hydratase
MRDIEVLDGVARLKLAAGKGNAMTAELLDGIRGWFERVTAPGGEARAVVVIGDDRFFSAGLALPSLIGLDRPAMEAFIEGFAACMLTVFACPLPVVAAVSGHAIAGGCVLALMADVRLMADGDARIGLNEVQLGIGLPSVVVESLRMSVPPASILPIALEGQLFAPRRARELGLVDELVAPADLETRALARARELAQVPASGFAQVKAALRGPVLATVERNSAMETERWLDSWFSDEGRARIGQTVARLTRR